VELRVKLTRSQLETLDRAREVLAHGGHVPSLPEIMVKALGDLLDRGDPLRKARTRSGAGGEEGCRFSGEAGQRSDACGGQGSRCPGEGARSRTRGDE